MESGGAEKFSSEGYLEVDQVRYALVICIGMVYCSILAYELLCCCGCSCLLFDLDSRIDDA